ncbi:MAG TPA: hypothetical protein VMV73_00345 [Candidatus Dormibacteraeota bacterium]|nr:hypothetical protein [Candidatus Dormibacteraeota bacterium]
MTQRVVGRRHWIPPGAFAFGQLAHGASWIVGIAAALSLANGDGGWQLAWVHIVVLGWFTAIAFGVLLHALPAFTDGYWRAEALARFSIFGFCVGVVGMAAAFATASPWLLYAGFTTALFACIYIAAALATLWKPLLQGGVESAVAGAFALTLVLLLATVALGCGLVLMRVGEPMPWWIVRVPEIHAVLGSVGWLSLLVFGVSMRTLRRITGVGPTNGRRHIATGALTLLAVLFIVSGLAVASIPLVWIGALCFGVGSLFYVRDAIVRLRNATVRHRLPQAFAIASVLWLLVALVLGAAALAGRATPDAYLFVLLLGWIGQMVNAHVYHIGVRLIATIYRGDDDETQPESLLSPILGWLSLTCFQLGIALVTLGLLATNEAATVTGFAAGFLGWSAMCANLLVARRRAMIAEAYSMGEVRAS